MNGGPDSPEPDAEASPALPTALAESRRRFLAFVEARVGSRADAEEILQSAFVRGVESAGTVRNDESVVAWFYRVLRNAIVDHHRRRGAERKAFDRLALESSEVSSQVPDELHGSLCACLGDVIQTLRPDQEEILREVDLRDRPVHDVAAEAGITPGNARVRLHRARQVLRRRVEATCGPCAEHGCLNCTCAHPTAARRVPS